jgi:uncharacterized Zn finger protein
MLTNLLNETALEELAGERAFDRGADYFAEGHVVGLKEQDGVVTARVRGSHDYRVKLRVQDDKIAFECTCPVGQDGVFCKHCAAVGLAWLDKGKQTSGVEKLHGERELTDKQIRAHLMALDKGALVDSILEYSEWDSEFRDRLVLMTAGKGGNQPDLAAFRAAIDKAIRTRGFVDCGRMPAYVRGIEVVIDSLNALLKRGQSPA